MKNQKFSKPPLSDEEKEKLANKFIQVPVDGKVKEVSKQKAVPLYLRVPESLIKDIRTIIGVTGLTMNAICLEILRPAIKKKLKELKDE